LLRGKRLQVILMVRKHPKDFLSFIWDAVPNEVRGASLMLGRTKRRRNEVRGASLMLCRTTRG
jgi:hypothetical protein